MTVGLGKSRARTGLGVLTSALGWLATVGIRGGGGLAWRAAAVSLGILGAGWVASAIPSLLDARAESPQVARAQGAVALTGAVPEAATVAARSEWTEVKRAAASFALSIQELDGRPVRQVSRRDVHSQAREEQLQAGDFSSEAVFARLVLRRQETAGTATFFVDMSRHASDSGLSIVRNAQAVPVVTKFGAIEAADLRLSDGRQTRHCLGFRHVAEGVGFGFRGWLCGSAQRVADRQQLTCLVERITLLAAGDDRALRAHFSKAELQRQPQCLPPKLQAAGRKTSWLDPDQVMPALRRNGG